MELFKLFGTLGLNGVEAFNEKIDGASGKAETLASKIGKGLGTAAKIGGAAIAVAATGIAFLTKSSLAAYADYEQLVGGVDTLFKDSSQKVQQYAQNAYITSGLSANQYMETVTSFSASLLQSLSGDTAAAADVADMALRDMSDNANKMGSDMAAIQNAYQGFAKQNYTMLDNLKLGYGGTKSEMERLLRDAQELTGVKYDIDNLNDVYQAIHVIQDELGIAGATAEEAISTIQGSLSSLKAAWQNLLVGFADDNQDIQVLVDRLVSSVSVAAKNIVPRISQILGGISNALAAIIPVVTAELPALLSELLPGLIEGAISLVDGLVSALPDILSRLMAIVPILLDALPTITQTIISACGSIIETIIVYLSSPANLQMLLSAALDLLMQIVQAIPQIAQFLGEALPDIILTIVTFLTEPGTVQAVLNGAVALLMAIIQAIPQISMALVTSLPTIVNQIVAVLTDPANFQMIVEAGITLISGLFEMIPTIATFLIENGPQILLALVEGLWAGVEALFGAIGQICAGVWEKFKSALGIGGGSSTEAKAQGQSVATGFAEGMQGIPEQAGETFSEVKSNITSNVSATRSQVSSDFSAMRDEMSSVSIGAGDGVASSFGNMRDTVSDSMASTSAEVTSKSQNIRSTMNSQLTETESIVTTKFEAMQKIATEKMSVIAEAVKKGVDEIKEAFDIDLKFRSVIVPKFSLTGKFDPENNKVPTVKAEPKTIYFAEGGIVDSATLFGMLGNRPMVAGEKGKEAIAPIDTLQTYVSEAVAIQNSGLIDALDRVSAILSEIRDSMGDDLKAQLENTSLSLNNREFGRLVRGVV